MRRLLAILLSFVALSLAGAQGGSEGERFARVMLEHGGGSGVLRVELEPAGVWERDIFVSLYRGDFRERKGIRPDAQGEYRLPVRVPEGGEWGVYLRYGVAQAGYAGYGRIRVSPGRGTATTIIELDRGFMGEVPSYVQPLGFAVFVAIALLAVLGLRWLLLRIREVQDSLAPQP